MPYANTLVKRNPHLPPPGHGYANETYWTNMLPHGWGFWQCLTTYIRYTVISYLMYVDKQCPHAVGHFLCFDTIQCQFPHMSEGMVGISFNYCIMDWKTVFGLRWERVCWLKWTICLVTKSNKIWSSATNVSHHYRIICKNPTSLSPSSHTSLFFVGTAPFFFWNQICLTVNLITQWPIFCRKF